jgi:hypothetical protein
MKNEFGRAASLHNNSRTALQLRLLLFRSRRAIRSITFAATRTVAPWCDSVRLRLGGSAAIPLAKMHFRNFVVFYDNYFLFQK